MSVYVSLGRWGGIEARAGRWYLRVVLGWLVVAAAPIDVDHVVGEWASGR